MEDYTHSLIEEYMTEEHSFDASAGYRGVGCKNLSQEIVDKITTTDHSNLVISGESIIATKKWDMQKPAKLVVDGNTLWDYLYYRGGTKEHPVRHPVYTITDLNGAALRFFTKAVSVEDTVLIYDVRANKVFVTAIWYDEAGGQYHVNFGLPSDFIQAGN